MTGLDKNQLEVARILFGLRAAEGFTLAGGSALVAQGAIDRTTRDIDAFVAGRPGAIPGDVLPLSVDLTAALIEADWVVTRVRSHATFVRLVAARGEASVEIDLAVDSPPLFPSFTSMDFRSWHRRILLPARFSRSLTGQKAATSPIFTR